MVIQRFILSGRSAVFRPPDFLLRRAFRSSPSSSSPPPPASYLSDPENRGKRQPGTNFDQLGSWQNRLELSVNIEESIKHGRLIPSIRLESIGQLSLQGRRPENEDRILVEPLSDQILLLAIFDGHGGSLAVDYCQAHFAEQLKGILEKQEDGGLQGALRQAFCDVNHNFTRFVKNNFHRDEAALMSGTTATVCLLRSGTELVIGHVGDSRATLCREGQSLRLTTDHEPDLPEERERIQESGGKVLMSSLGKPRVMGRLDMSRSIGDIDLKQYGVTAEPDIRSIQIKHGRDAFLVLTTDGIHRVLNSTEVVSLLSSCRDPPEACRMLLDQALMFGSEDNCTALVVPFGAWGKFAASGGNVVRFALSRSLSSRNYV
ncbi:hypothetical protein CAPTEDRAFT_179751 [Capitella teleta]|uniref:PPM-type phosphatase domain-containing protein n=1 Tax=Capitella teleta TaxID=283909 RepID=R7THH9_CAPTE|nr:hypothetical protein CAPTEDRAFT_179751 [Capitella teleta]|eukprot:ELT90570.1 hypothetical protein CAPTEDRAFT_179751 [Capitella teleta]